MKETVTETYTASNCMECRHCYEERGLCRHPNGIELNGLDWDNVIPDKCPLRKNNTNSILHKVINGNVVLDEKTESLMNGDRIVAVNYNKREGEFYLTNTKNNPITTQMVDKKTIFLAYTRWFKEKAYDKLKEINFSF